MTEKQKGIDWLIERHHEKRHCETVCPDEPECCFECDKVQGMTIDDLNEYYSCIDKILFSLKCRMEEENENRNE